MTPNFETFNEEIQRIPEIETGLVSIWFTDAQGKVTLESIWSEIERGKGHATKAMTAVIEIADKYCIDIHGLPHALRYDTETQERSGLFSEEQIDLWDQLNENCLTNEQLVGWYARFGFDLTGGSYDDDPEIIRRANQPMATLNP